MLHSKWNIPKIGWITTAFDNEGLIILFPNTLITTIDLLEFLIL